MATERAVHPAAAVFPMLSDDELRDLAEDIKANGLLHPIVLDSDGVLIDGRNRLAACKLAGVEPTFTQLNGHDPFAYILSSNINRRHMSKGQQAVAIARMLLVSNRSQSDAARHADVSRARIVQAAAVLEYVGEWADRVLDGSTSLDDAYAEARKRKDAASSMEAQMGRLRAEATDLADLVVEERISLRDGLALLDKRRADERRRREAATAGLLSAVRFLAPPAGDIAAHADKLLASLDPSLVPGAESITSAVVERAIAFLEVVLVGLDQREEDRGSTQA